MESTNIYLLFGVGRVMGLYATPQTDPDWEKRCEMWFKLFAALKSPFHYKKAENLTLHLVATMSTMI